MPSNLRVIHARDFIKASLDGELDLAKSKDLLIEIASASAGLADFEVLVDVRKAQMQLSFSDMWFLAEALAHYRAAFSGKTAVLCPVEGFDQARFFEQCARHKQFKLRAFTSFEDAIDWLIDSAP